MKFKVFLAAVMVVMVLVVASPSGASAEVVGRLTQVDGRVDLLKGGKLPATPLKLGDNVESGDVLRSKSLSKAQVTFIDNSVITLSPESRLAIDDYQFEPAKQKRNAVFTLFQGLAHVVVNKLYKVDEPDFVIKTQTAITGVRGTDFGVRLAPNSSIILNFEGKTRVASNFPEVGAMLKRAGKIAYGPNSGGSFFSPGHFVDLGNMQGTEVQRGMPPTLPFSITSEDRQQFMDQMAGGLLGRRGTGGGSGTGAIGSHAMLPASMSQTQTTSSVPDVAPLGLVTGTGSAGVTLINVVTVPPTVAPSTDPKPSPSTFNFTQQYYAAWVQMADAPSSQSSLGASSWGQRTGVYGGYFYGSTAATRTATAGNTFSPLDTGTSTGTATGTVTGYLGQALKGTMTYTGTSSSGSTINRTGTVTLLPTGQLTYNWTDTVKVGSVTTATGTGTSAQTPGTYFSQIASGSFTQTPNIAGNQATISNSGDLTGTRTMAGVTNSIRAGFSVTNTGNNAGTFESDAGSITINSQGVLGAPDATGGRTGVMTSTATTASGDNKVGGPVTYIPGTATTPAATFGQLIGNPSGTGHTTLGMLAQTSDTGAQIATQTYQGSYAISPTSSTTGTLSSTGWGSSNTTKPAQPPSPSYPVRLDTVGNMTATVTDPSGLNTEPGVINQTAAAVFNPSTYAGVGQGVGIVNNNSVVSTTGTVNGSTGTMDFNGNFVSPNNRGTLTGGTLSMTSGTSVTMTPSSPGSTSITLSPPSSTGPPYTQSTTLAGTLTSAGTTQVLSNSIITSNAGTQAFPSPGTVSSNINVQGVVNNSTGTGAVTVTVNPTGTLPSPVSTYMGPVSSISPTLNVPVLVGRNPANPGVNIVPANQSGTVQTTLASPSLAATVSPTSPLAQAR